MEENYKWLVETQWLEKHLNSPDIIVLDCSWHMPQTKRNAYKEYLAERIPGAKYFDIDTICNSSTDLPHMLPDSIKFSSMVRKMGIGDGTKVVVYDTYGFFCAAARVWWMFRIMGHNDVRVLNGGMSKWHNENREVDTLPPRETNNHTHFTPMQDSTLLANKEDIISAMDNDNYQIIDARSPDRFSGKMPEPREGLKPGHMPGAINLFFNSLLEIDGSFKPKTEMIEIAKAAGIDFKKQTITTCGSGVTAAVPMLALDELGMSNIALYDGSWAEWGSIDELPNNVTD